MDFHPKFAIGGEKALERAGCTGLGRLSHDGAAPVAALALFRAAKCGGLGKRDHRIDTDDVGPALPLVEAGGAKARAIADMMRALRPGLDYGGEAA